MEGAGLSCASLVVRIGFGLFLTPYMLHVLGDRAFGVFALASLFAGWCGLLDFGLTTTTGRYVTRYYTKDDWESVNETGSTAIILFGGIAVLVFLLSCLAYGVTRALGDSFDETGLLASALFFAGLSFAISKISDGFCGVIRGALRQEYAGAAALATRVVVGFANLATLMLGGGVIALLAVNTVVTAAQLLAYVAMTRLVVPRFRFSLFSFRKSRVRTLFNYSFYAFLAQAGEIAVNRSDLIIIAALTSIESVTPYNLVVVTLTSYFNSFLAEGSNWETNWFAHLAAKEKTTEDVAAASGAAREGFRDRIRRALGQTNDAERFSPEFYASRSTITRVSIYASLFGALGILVLGRPFVERWVGAEYLVAFPALALTIAAQGLYRGSGEVNSRLLQGVARHQVLAFASLAHGILNIVLSVAFLRMGFGLFGVAAGTVIPGIAIHYLWIPNVVCRLVGEREKDYWRRQLKATAVGIAASALPATLAVSFARPDYLSIAFWAFATFLLYGIVVFALGLTKEERARARGFAVGFLSRRGY